MIVACDTNIVLYTIDSRDPRKRLVAKRLMRDLRASHQLVIPWQVVGETLFQLRR